jgi:amino acid adenylation domain-containing protein
LFSSLQFAGSAIGAEIAFSRMERSFAMEATIVEPMPGPECPTTDHVGPVDRLFEAFPDSALYASIVERFEAIVERFPDRLAIEDQLTSLTYRKLGVLVARISAGIASTTAHRVGPIAILLDRDARYVAAMLGVLTAGRAYVPLDDDFPAERNALIVSKAAVCAVVSSHDLIGAAGRWLPRELPVIDIDDLPDGAEATHVMRPGPDNLAAIYYTSGSSGVPKGVAWAHRDLLKCFQLHTNEDRISCADRMLLQFSPATFGSYRTVYCALLNGASLHILPARAIGVAALAKQMRNRGITFYSSVPTILCHLVESLGCGECFDSVRIISMSGERIQWSDVDAARRGFPRDASLKICLASSECAWILGWCVDDTLRSSTALPPVGRPWPTRAVAIVGEDGNAVADGDVGDIVVSSSYIALGYWDGAALQVRAFPPDPADPTKRVFNTGDRGRRRPDGLIEFVGRRDQQIKLHGHRIEPAEVEAALAGLPEVNDAIVIVRYSESNVPLSLVAYVALQAGIHGLLPRHLQAMLAQRLPRYMVPAKIYLLDELPYLPNFKVDRQALARLDTTQAIKVLERGDDPFLDQIAGIFEAVIGLKGATPEDTVASLGGDSLQELNVFAELERRYGVAIPDSMINQRPTISSIAWWMANKTPRLGTHAVPR